MCNDAKGCCCVVLARVRMLHTIEGRRTRTVQTADRFDSSNCDVVVVVEVPRQSSVPCSSSISFGHNTFGRAQTLCSISWGQTGTHRQTDSRRRRLQKQTPMSVVLLLY